MRGRPVLVLCLTAVAGWCQRPLPAEQDRVIEATRQTALNYARWLPDFICTEIIKRYDAYGPRANFQSVDTLTIQLSFFRQRETYKLMLHNGRPTDQTYESVAGAFTKGEFGSDLAMIFEPESKTEFQWKSSANVRKHRVSVYSFRVDQANSSYALIVGHDTVHTAYHGTLDIDPETNLVYRLASVADIPAGFPVAECSTTIDYDFVDVSGNRYLLPVHTESLAADVPPKSAAPMPSVRRGGTVMPTQTRYWNVADFRSYRKFSADSKLTFDK